MFCPHCGTNVQDQASFCAKCGAAIANAAPGPVSVPPPIPQAPKTSGLAIASLVSSCLFFLLLPSVLAVVLGHVALSKIKKSGGVITGRGIAITGLALGYTGILFSMLILPAIFIPNLLRARMAANAVSAVGTVRAINIAEISYADLHPNQGYSCSLEELNQDGMLNPSMASGQKSGYRFAFSGCAPEQAGGPSKKYRIAAYPDVVGSTGTRTICSDESAVVRWVDNGNAEDCFQHGSPI